MSATRGQAARFGIAVAIFVALIVVNPRPASADLSPFLSSFGEVGSGSGELKRPRGITFNPANKRLYVSDYKNNRIEVFTVWGGFVEAWGWGVADGTSAERQSCTATCFAGIGGSAPGQLDEPSGITIDATGAVYVFERSNLRVQKFDASGVFLWEIGGEVNDTTGENICTAADIAGGDTCGAGVSGAAAGFFGVESLQAFDGNYIAIGKNGDLFVGDKNRIQVFGINGAFKSQLPLPEAGNPGAMAIDPVSGDIYFSFVQNVARPGVYRLSSSTGSIVSKKLPVANPQALATDAAGNVYVVDDPPTFASPDVEAYIVEYDSDGDQVGTCCRAPQPDPPFNLNFQEISAVGTNSVGDLYAAYANASGSLTVSKIDAYGPPPASIEAPPPASPIIVSQYAVSAGTDTAVVRAQINPRFWADTKFYVEYGTTPCSGGGCTDQPAAPGLSLGNQIVNAPVTSKGVTLTGLAPATTYFFRFIAISSGGGPTIPATEAKVTTPALPVAPNTNCANQQYRQGSARFLPDCRGYELVSPVDKDGGDIIVNCDVYCNPARFVKSSGAGDALTYSSYKAFGNPSAAPFVSQYFASRTASGWGNAAISPPRDGAAITPGPDLDTTYKAFSEDLSKGWLFTDTEPVLAPGGVPGFANFYARDSVTGSYSPITTVQPPSVDPGDYTPELQGISPDGLHTIFRANAKLTSKAINSSTFKQLYEQVGEELRLVSIKPNGTAAALESSLGGKDGAVVNALANTSNAVSDDGSRIFWTESSTVGSGKIYVRIDGTSTTAVSTEQPSTYITANGTGTKAIVLRPGTNELYEINVDSKTETLIAQTVTDVLGWSDDANRIYFVATGNLAPGGELGKPNLYFKETGAPPVFIGQLSPGDVEAGNKISPVASELFRRRSRVTPDGNVAVFMSTARLTGFDNVDANSSKADAEVFRYEAGTDTLACVSCNPTGVAPSGRELQIERAPSGRWAAAQIQPRENQMYAPRALSDNGNRVFFESFEALVPSDTNNAQDVYQWEAPGEGECTSGSASFSPLTGGCVGLISSGDNASDSEFVDASASGNDVFFTTAANLVSVDTTAIDIYDARVGGGLAGPAAAPTGCEGEACQPPAPPPAAVNPPSSSFNGPVNPKPKKHKKKHHKKKKGKKAQGKKAGAKRHAAKPHGAGR